MCKGHIFSVAIAILLLLPIAASAHSGRTDGSGGHMNHSTGEYHYHHGYSAHDHYDIDGDGDKDCPYNFDDQTGQSTGSNTGEETHSRGVAGDMLEKLGLVLLAVVFGGPVFFVIYGVAFFLVGKLCMFFLHFTPLTEAKKDRYYIHITNAILLVVLYIFFLYPVAEWLCSSADWIAAILIIVGIAAYIGICYCVNKSESEHAMLCERNTALAEVSALKKENENLLLDNNQLARINKAQSANLSKLQNECDFFSQDNRFLQNELFRLTQACSAEESVIMELPLDIYFINGNVPVKGKITEHKPFGDYTAYVAPKGQCYHSDWRCGSGDLHAVHIFEVYGKKPPCQKCGEILPDGVPEWFVENRHRFSLK